VGFHATFPSFHLCASSEISSGPLLSTVQYTQNPHGVASDAISGNVGRAVNDQFPPGAPHIRVVCECVGVRTAALFRALFFITINQ
jgi:hypothetical protein